LVFYIVVNTDVFLLVTTTGPR